jgi:RNA ligase
MDFPIIRSLDDVFPALEGHDEFRVMDKGTHWTIDYIFQQQSSFRPNPAHGSKAEEYAILRRECCGLKFDKEGRLLARPFHKFFNLFETEETQPRALPLESAMVTEKLDGSMIHPVLMPGDKLALMTMQWRSPIARQAEEHALASRHGYEDFCMSLLRRGLMPIFEWCSRQQRIIVDHPEDRLVLLTVRHQIEGWYLAQEDVEAAARPYDVPTVRAERIPDDFSGWLARIRALPVSEEGVVLVFPSGQRVKVKGDAYIKAHQAMEGVGREAWVLDLILTGKEDDVLPFLPPEAQEAMIGFANSVREGLKGTAARIEARAEELLARAGGDRRILASFVTQEPQADQAFLFQAANKPGSVLERLLQDALKKRLTEERIEQIRSWWGNVRWRMPRKPGTEAEME